MLEKIDAAIRLLGKHKVDEPTQMDIAKKSIAELELLNLLIGLRAEVAEFATNVNKYYNGGCGTPEELIEKMAAVFNVHPKMFKPSVARYQPGESTFLATGQFDDNDGIFIEWIEAGRIVVRINGKDYKQTIEDFVNNCYQ